MNRKDFLKSLVVATAAAGTVPGRMLNAGQAAREVEDSHLRRVYRLQEDGNRGAFFDDFREERVAWEDLQPGDVFHMYEPDGTPVEGGVWNLALSEPYVDKGVWTIRCEELDSSHLFKTSEKIKV